MKLDLTFWLGLIALVIWVTICDIVYRNRYEEALLKGFVRCLLIIRYGIRGGLKPPLAHYARMEHTGEHLLNPRKFGTLYLWYRWRHLCWTIDSSLYTWTGLPDIWFQRTYELNPGQHQSEK